MGGWLQLAATDESTQPPQQTVDPRTLLQQCQRASRMVVKGKKTKNPPVLSHEFVIQNHADIVACVAMVFVVGLMFQISSPAASVFIALHHNVSVPTKAPRRMDLVTNDREGFLGNSSFLNFLLDVVLKIYRMSVYQWQHSCSDVFIF